MKKTIKILSTIIAVFFYVNVFSQQFIPSLGYKVDSMRNYANSLKPIAYEEEVDSTTNDLLLKSAFEHYNLGIICTEGFCSAIIIYFKDTVSLNHFVNIFDSSWESLGHGNWDYIDYAHNVKSRASLFIKDEKVYIKIIWKDYDAKNTESGSGDGEYAKVK
jgi:hypothetical protein